MGANNLFGFPTNNVRSHVYVTGGTGFGSTNTVIRRLTDIEINVGKAITYRPSVISGDSFTINEDGLYFVGYSDFYDSTDAAWYLGVSKNSNQLTTRALSLTAPSRVGISLNAHSGSNTITAVLYLNAGDILRPHGDTVLASGSNSSTNFRVVKISD
jgi:hypothetical protein